jgi:hypothetical protein
MQQALGKDSAPPSLSAQFELGSSSPRSDTIITEVITAIKHDPVSTNMMSLCLFRGCSSKSGESNMDGK